MSTSIAALFLTFILLLVIQPDYKEFEISEKTYENDVFSFSGKIISINDTGKVAFVDICRNEKFVYFKDGNNIKENMSVKANFIVSKFNSRRQYVILDFVDVSLAE